MATIQKRFGERVKRFRREKGMSQMKLAELARMDITSINEIESGNRNSSLRTIQKIANALKVLPKELLY